MCTVTSFRMKSLRVINYIYYKVLTSREELWDKRLSHPHLFSCDKNKLKHPSCHCRSDHRADEGAFKACFTIYLLLIMCLIMALPHTRESLHFLLIHLPPPIAASAPVSCSWLSPPHFPLKSPLPPKVSFLVWQYAHMHTSNLGPSHERKQLSLDFIFFTFKILRKLTAKTVRKCSDYIYKTNHFTLFLLNTFVCKERHKTEEPFKHHQHYRTFQQSLERGNILNSSKFFCSSELENLILYKETEQQHGEGLACTLNAVMYV